MKCRSTSSTISSRPRALLHTQPLPAPELDSVAYRLSIRGAVRRELSLSYADIRAMPLRSCIAALECAGNSRHVSWCRRRRHRWELGAVGNAEWTGVPLSALLERRWAADDVCELVLEGAIAACRRGGAETAGRNLLRPQHPEEAGAGARRADRLRDEWTGPDTRSWVSAARHRAGALRHGVGKVADRHRCHHATLQGYWQTSDYAYWDDSRRTTGSPATRRNEVESPDRAPRAYGTLGAWPATRSSAPHAQATPM